MPIRGNKSLIAGFFFLLMLITGVSVSASAIALAPAQATTSIFQVKSSANDAEQNLNSGNVNITDPDLQLGELNNTQQLVGIRFTNVTIPSNAVIVSAYVEFEVGATGSNPTSVTIRGQASDNAPAFSSEKDNISTRPRTTSSVAWNNIPAWSVLNAKSRTPNISAIINEVVNRPNWVSGNPIAIIINGSGERTALSYDGDPAGAPRLIINFTIPTPRASPTSPVPPIPTNTRVPPPAGSTRFAIIGDYGSSGQPELDVANLVKGWDPDFIITTGDNNYPSGSTSTIDTNIGQYYHEFIYPYAGTYGPGATTNRFFPSLGNHDWQTTGAQPYLNYFTLPGNERYYDYVRGPVHFFVVDSDAHEPDGITSSSAQATWLRDRLAASTSVWNIVYMHHPPYSSSSEHGSTSALQWPYADWGADVVLAGHDHTYERIFRNGIVYFVNGLGGNPSRYSFGAPISGSQVRYNSDHGAMLVEANNGQITFEFINRKGATIDTYTLSKTAPPVHTPTATSVSTPGAGKYDDTHANWAYTGSWTHHSGSFPFYNNTDSYSGVTGDTASFTFTGRQFILTYTMNTVRGNMEIYVDGNKLSTINANGPQTFEVLYTSPVLSSGTHVMQVRNAGGGGGYIDVDAIQILNTPPLGAGKYDDTHSNWVYTGSWTHHSGSFPFYNNTDSYSGVTGDTASFTFAGSQFILTYTVNTVRGNMEIYVDGNKVSTINAYGPQTFQVLYTSAVLPSGTHVVQVRNAGGGAGYVDVDAIEILNTAPPGAGKYDDTHANWVYTGLWTHFAGAYPFYNNTDSYSGAIGDTASFTFTGTQFILTYTMNTVRGTMEIYVDGSNVATLNAYGPQTFEVLYTSPVLSNGTHVVKIRNAGGGLGYIDVDAIQIN